MSGLILDNDVHGAQYAAVRITDDARCNKCVIYGECLTKLCVIRFTSMSETVLYKIIHETPLLVSEFTGLVVFCIYIFIFVSFSFVVAFLILLFI